MKRQEQHTPANIEDLVTVVSASIFALLDIFDRLVPDSEMREVMREYNYMLDLYSHKNADNN